MEADRREQGAKRPAATAPPAPARLSAKARRKQPNPSRIATVQVPKHPSGLDSDVDCSETVPGGPESPSTAFPLVPALWPDRALKIFNQEAFCHLCNKEFCNKYFLKTHKANKHGIYQAENGKPRRKPPTTVQSQSTNETASTLQEEEQRSPLNLMVSDDRDECSSENLEKLQTMLLRLTPSEDRPEEDGEPREPEELSDSSAGSPEPRRRNKPTSSYCEICNKELCNKYFMRTHMQRMHGIELEHGAQIGGVVCNICNKELCSKYFLRVHKQNTHGVALLGAPSTSGAPKGGARPPGTSTACHVCSKRFRSAKWLQAHLLSDHQEPDPQDTLISKLFWETSGPAAAYTCSQCPFTTPVLAFLFVHERSHFVLPSPVPDPVKPSASLQDLIHDKTFWQHKITQQLPECLDLSLAAPKLLPFEPNGS